MQKLEKIIIGILIDSLNAAIRKARENPERFLSPFCLPLQ